jgi:Kunitz/Bovine pancreatic trypsin inhibitor domain
MIIPLRKPELLLHSLMALSALVLVGCHNYGDPSSTKLPDACYQPPESGMCKAAFQRYYYDQESDSCKSFTWGGCKGSVPFETQDACVQTCNASNSEPAAPAKTYRSKGDPQ